MKEQEVYITVTGLQSADGDTDQVEMTTTGVYRETAEGFSLTYEETLDDAPDTVTTLDVKNEETVLLTREGALAMQMMIQKGERHICHYRTPFGEIVMGVYGSEVTVTDERLNIKYTLDVNASLVSRNEVDVQFKTTEL